MLKITASPEVLAKLATILESEPGGTCVRLREYTVGAACHAKQILGPALDKSPEEEERVTIDGITFVAAQDFLDTYGDSFSLEIENGRLGISPAVEKRKLEEKKGTIYADFSMDE